MEKMTIEEFKKDVLKNKEKYIGQFVIIKEKNKKYMVGIVKDVKKTGLKVFPIIYFKTFRDAKKFMLILSKILKNHEEIPSYIA